jgi:hypothetical protein
MMFFSLLFVFLSCISQKTYTSWSDVCQKPHSFSFFMENLDRSDPSEIKHLLSFSQAGSCQANIQKGLQLIQAHVANHQPLNTSEKILLNVGFLKQDPLAKECFDQMVKEQTIDSVRFFQLSALEPHIVFSRLDTMIQDALSSPTDSKSWQRLSALTGDLMLWLGYIDYLTNLSDDIKSSRLLTYYLFLSQRDRESLRPALTKLCRLKASPCLAQLNPENPKGKEFQILKLLKKNKDPHVISRLLDYSETHPEKIIRIQAGDLLTETLQASSQL